jgi:hypothetical protein
MKQIIKLIVKSFLKIFLLYSSCFLLLSLPVYACTIFTLTNYDHTQFCNNEDWKDPDTIIWFVPAIQDSSAGKMKFGCAYLGFANQWAQGGVNTERLAFDVVAGYKEIWKRENHLNLKAVRGNPSERMLESCATIEEAIAFYKLYWEPTFSYAKILISDGTGKSVVIGARNDELEFNISKQSCGIGYGFKKNPNLLEENLSPTLANASKLLKDAIQEGQYGTKYSNVFDLKTGDIFIYRFSHQTNPVKLNLAEELKKGAHYYDIPEIEEQLTEKLKSISRFKEWLKKLKPFKCPTTGSTADLLKALLRFQQAG